jgi:hypothetical protein
VDVIKPVIAKDVSPFMRVVIALWWAIPLCGFAWGLKNTVEIRDLFKYVWCADSLGGSAQRGGWIGLSDDEGNRG